MKRNYIMVLMVILLPSFSHAIVRNDSIDSLEKKTSKRNLVKELLEADLSKKTKKSERVKDITGLAFKTGSSASIPEKYKEVALENNWNPNTMSNDDMEKEYNSIIRWRYLRLSYMLLGMISIGLSIRFMRDITK